MRVVRLQDLKNQNEANAPFYCVLKDDRSDRDFGCANLAFLNLHLLLRKKIGVQDGKSALDILRENQAHLPEDGEKSVSFKAVFEFLETQEIFDGFRVLVLNPNGMVPEVFFEIALRRLLSGNIALAIVEVPDYGEAPKAVANHLAVLHCEDGEVYLDSLKLDLDTFIKILYFSPINTLMFFGQNKGGE